MVISQEQSQLIQLKPQHSILMQDLVQNTMAEEISRRKDQSALIVENQGILWRSAIGYTDFHQDLSSGTSLWQIKFPIIKYQDLGIRCQFLGMSLMLNPVKAQPLHFHSFQSPSHNVSSFWLS